MEQIPETQTVALVCTLGGNVEFLKQHPVPTPCQNEVLAKVLYTGVCQSGVHSLKPVTKNLQLIEPSQICTPKTAPLLVPMAALSRT